MEYLEPDNVYALPDGTIIHVEQGLNVTCPMADMGIPVYAYKTPYLSSSSYSDAPDDDVLRTFAEFYHRTRDGDNAVALTKRYYRTFFNDEARHLRLGSWRGYSQSNWLEYAYIAEYDISKEFGLYLQGDVSVVTVDYPDGEFDCLGGIYGDYGHVSADDMETCFGLDISEAREATRTVTYTYSDEIGN